MQKVEVQFNIVLDKNIYKNTACNTREEFVNQFLVSNIAHDYHFIANSLEQQKPDEKEKYAPYLETLKNIKSSIQNSIKYELLSTQDNVETVKITCSFDYFDNEISSLEKTVETELFTIHIRKAYFMVKDIPRIFKNQYHDNDKDKQIAHAVSVYQLVGDMLNNAKSAVQINGNAVQYESFAA